MPIDDITDGLKRDSKLDRQFALTHALVVQSTHLDNLLCLQFAFWPIFSAAHVLQHRIRHFLSTGISAFGSGISVIIPLCSEEQMGRVTARRIVASVANALLFRNIPVRKTPSDTGGWFRWSRPEPKLTVSLRVSGTRPFPTFIGTLFSHFAPEVRYLSVR